MKCTLARGSTASRRLPTPTLVSQTRDLTPSEATLLAGLPQAPSAYNPWTNPSLVRARRHQVLQAMVREHYLSSAEAQQIDNGPLGVGPAPRHYPDAGRTFVSHEVVPWLAAHGYHNLSTAGLRVTTTLDLRETARLRAEVSRTVDELQAQGANYGGAVELDPRDGHVRAWAGDVGAGPAASDGWDVVNQIPVEPGQHHQAAALQLCPPGGSFSDR